MGRFQVHACKNPYRTRRRAEAWPAEPRPYSPEFTMERAEVVKLLLAEAPEP